MISTIIKKSDISTLNKIAIISNGNEYTYAELWTNIKRLSKWIDLNYEKQCRIGVLLDNCVESVFALFAIIISGGILAGDWLKSANLDGLEETRND